ncbi:hypothetical protein B0J13DRAFT_565572 [Dactylonectria estremocensis]|uniref:NAD(P)-binding domain-containing protein n=1 Tax=Dactylonectria estremocensis TaxID=1079267 RepID=A0A9P9DUR6_9HYPO|nr:hypothetical protein B0J13DRAFT_565572 [Dactylonectria estremocensis]
MSNAHKPTILVLGATGPAGVCLLRELLHRRYPTVVYARSPSKIPTDVTSNALITVIKGEMSDANALSEAMAKTSIILSLLGPNIADKKVPPSLFADIYVNSIFPVMRKLGVRRIIAMGTLSISSPDDQWTFFQPMVHMFMKLFARPIYDNMINLAAAFKDQAQGLDWTVFRIAQIPGESDEASWSTDRKDQVYAGPIGGKGWSSSVRRAALTKWIVNNMESNEWVGKMPGVSRLAN